MKARFIIGVISLLLGVGLGITGGPTPALAGEGHTPIIICHNGHEIVIDDDAWPAHAAHGDTKGVCPADPAPTVTATKTVEVPGPTVTATKTVEVPGPKTTVTVTAPGATATETVSVPGPEVTVTATATETATVEVTTTATATETATVEVTATETATVEVPGPTMTATETVPCTPEPSDTPTSTGNSPAPDPHEASLAHTGFDTHPAIPWIIALCFIVGTMLIGWSAKDTVTARLYRGKHE